MESHQIGAAFIIEWSSNVKSGFAVLSGISHSISVSLPIVLLYIIIISYRVFAWAQAFKLKCLTLENLSI